MSVEWAIKEAAGFVKTQPADIDKAARKLADLLTQAHAAGKREGIEAAAQAKAVLDEIEDMPCLAPDWCDIDGEGGCVTCIAKKARALLQTEARAETGEDASLTHRPSALDLDHTACGLPLKRFPIDRNLQLGDGETCQRCTHVIAQVAKVRVEGKDPLATSAATARADVEANAYHQTLGAKWMCEAIVREMRTTFAQNRNAQAFANDIEHDRKWADRAYWHPAERDHEKGGGT